MAPLNAHATLGDELDAATPESPSSSASSSPLLDRPVAAASTTSTKRTPAAPRDPGLKRNGQPKKKKIRTYSRRKAEMAQLNVELEELQDKRERVSELAEEELKRRTLRDSEEQNRRLREAIHAQRLLLANTTSIISEFMDYNPFETFIRLGRDPAARRAAMLAIKPLKIQGAVQFLRENRRFMDPTAEFSEAKRFRARNGDVCLLQFEIAPFPGVSSIKHAFDALQSFVHNMEIRISEVMGDITVRENDDDDFDDSMTQHRLVTSVDNVVFLDTNNVTFAEYRPASGPGQPLHSILETDGGELGVIVAEYVDEDELYPYRPKERLRQDITILSMVEAHPQPGGERVVVVTRWAMFRFHQSEYVQLPPAVADRVFGGVGVVGKAMSAAVRHTA